MAVWLQRTLLASLSGVLMTLLGVFGSFAGRDVVSGVLGLNGVALAVLVCGGTLWALQSIPAVDARIFVWAAVVSLLIALPLAGLVLLASIFDLTFVFPNFVLPLDLLLPFGLGLPALSVFLLAAVVLGAGAGCLKLLSPTIRTIVIRSFLATTLISLLADEVDSVLAPADGLAAGVALVAGYLMSRTFGGEYFWMRLLLGFVNGAGVGVVFALIADGGGLAAGGILLLGDSNPILLALSPGSSLLPFILVFGGIGLVGSVLSTLPLRVGYVASYGAVVILVLAILALRQGFDILDELIVFVLSLLAFSSFPSTVRQSAARFAALSNFERRLVRAVVYLVALGALLGAPFFLGAYIANVLNLVGIFIILGLGLNIVVGNSGLLDLGYVAFFAIGAYVVGVLTTPNVLTCGLSPDTIPFELVTQTCTGVTSFWVAGVAAILAAVLAGVLLGVPVLRLRADYFALVTLSFGEIILRLLRVDALRDLFGGAQGITRIPRPTLDLSVLNPDWRWQLTDDTGVYYLIVAAIIVAIFVASHLNNSRIGRAWRALRADEAAAQASGIQRTRYKLYAFGISAGFAGLAGALLATRVYGAYPDSFTLQISISVLSLVIIGGMASIPGVIVGAFLLIGLPEVLREFSEYRLLVFALLLVYTMIWQPQGLLPLGTLGRWNRRAS
jgi:branched-chain amino acid transport system permease protein